MKLSLVLLVALCATAMAGTTTTAETTTAETTTAETTTAETTTEVATTTDGETTTEKELRCSFDRELGDRTGQNLFDAKFVRAKFDDEGDRDFGLADMCGKKADTDTNDFSFQWTAGKNDVYGIDATGDCKTWVQVRDATKCNGDVIACGKDAVNIKAKKNNVYGIHVYGRDGENEYKCKMELNIRRGCKVPYMTQTACEDKCHEKSVRHVVKKSLVYYPELVIENACPVCLCHRVHVPVRTTTTTTMATTTTTTTTTKKATKPPKTTTTTTTKATTTKATTTKATTTTTTTKATTTTTTKATTTKATTTKATTAAPTTTAERRRRRRRRSSATEAPVVCPSFRPCVCKEGSVAVSYYDDDGCEVDCACIAF